MILQRDTSCLDFPLLVYSQPAGLGLLADLLTSGAEHPADILADARDFGFDADEVLLVLR